MEEPLGSKFYFVDQNDIYVEDTNLRHSGVEVILLVNIVTIVSRIFRICIELIIIKLKKDSAKRIFRFEVQYLLVADI